jgi:invasion protein IalB
MRTGTTATFSYSITPEEGIRLPMSLKGFSDGFDSLP